MTRLFAPCLFLGLFFLPAILSADSAALPDGVKVTITKVGSLPASIQITAPKEKRITLQEGEWDRVPKSVRPYLSELFKLKKPASIDITLDCSESPESQEWGENAVKVAKEEFPKLVELLDSEGFKPTEKIELVFKKMDGVAYATGGKIVISADWIARQPGDIGMVVHELIHVVQAYRHRVPSWVTEGIADYIRFFVYEKNGERTCRVNPDRAKYTDSYRTTGAFFNWIVTTQDEKFITKLNAVCREGKYSDEFFKETTGKTLDELWDGFIKSLRK